MGYFKKTTLHQDTQVCACAVNELYLVQSKHVEVTDVVLLGVSDPGPALLLINHLADVLAYKLTLTGEKIR